MTQTMTGLTLIAGLPATYDLAKARVFPFKLDATEVADDLKVHTDQRDEARVEVVTHYLQNGRRCWVLRQRSCPTNKYMARVDVIVFKGRAGKEIHADR